MFCQKHLPQKWIFWKSVFWLYVAVAFLCSKLTKQTFHFHAPERQRRIKVGLPQCSTQADAFNNMLQIKHWKKTCFHLARSESFCYWEGQGGWKVEESQSEQVWGGGADDRQCCRSPLLTPPLLFFQIY